MKHVWQEVAVSIMIMVLGAGCGGSGSNSNLPRSTNTPLATSTLARPTHSTGPATVTPTPQYWRVKTSDNVLEVWYNNGQEFSQYAALHTDSCYFRMVYGPDCGWGTSVVLCPSFWETDTTPLPWEEMTSPNNQAREMVEWNGHLFILSLNGLFRSDDLGMSWLALPIDLNITGNLLAIDVDNDKLYVAARNGVLVSGNLSENLESNFSWSYRWSWDGTADVDCQDSYCWSVIVSWGSRSGTNRRTPDEKWVWKGHGIPWSTAGLLKRIVIDRSDPANAAYTTTGYDGQSYRTINGGEEWLKNDVAVQFATILSGAPTIFGSGRYSTDFGATWQPSGLKATAFTKDEVSGLIYAALTDGDVYRGLPNNWRHFGLRDQLQGQENVVSLAVSDEYVFTATDNGRVFRKNTTHADAPSVYHQGAPVTMGQWRVGEWGRLILPISATISTLAIDGEISIGRPSNNSIDATVRMSVSGDVILDVRPFETFKPVMLSSMYEGDKIWDSRQAKTGSYTLPIPLSGWIAYPPIKSYRFSLVGGTSDWKTNAPTVEIDMNRMLDITGWVMTSTDPNDDNVGLWAATDEVLPNWSYTITASKPQP